MDFAFVCAGEGKTDDDDDDDDDLALLSPCAEKVISKDNMDKLRPTDETLYDLQMILGDFTCLARLQSVNALSQCFFKRTASIY